MRLSIRFPADKLQLVENMRVLEAMVKATENDNQQHQLYVKIRTIEKFQ
jgi:hypothetical protein